MADDKLTRKDLISQVNRISKEILPLLPNSHQAYRINELLSDINSDYYTVVVVGEFNNGKSTFVNAIIGEDLLPMGVTPTTATINTLTWGEDRSLSINREGEKVEDMPLSKRFLERFIADADFDTEAVKYIRLTLPVDILKDKVMLIDTPGVADLNQQRVEITYGFIPRADAVIFLLNATTPMRRTEMEFLNETILKESSNQIIFVANYFDYIDEDEQDDILNEIKIRIQAAVGKKEPPVYSLSAKRALEARLSGNQKELEESGILEIETEIKNMIENGNQEHQKVMHFKNRLNRILYDIHQEITSTLNIYRASHEQLSKELTLIDMKFDKQENSKAMLEDLSKEGEREIAAAIKKLIYDFGESLREMVMMELDNYSGLEIKNFVEKQLPTKIKREIKQWYERYSPTIYVMLQKYEEALVIKLAEEFNTGVEKLNIMQDSKMPICLDVKIIDIYCEDISTIPVTAGFIAGGLSLATILMGVPILFPIAGMAGYPIIQKMMTEKKLHEAKNKLKPMLNQVLDDLIQKFQETIGTIVGSLIQDIQNAAVKRFDDYIKYIKMQVQEEIKDREVDSKQETMKIEQLDKAGKLLETMINNQT